MKIKEDNNSVKSDLEFVCEMQRTIDAYECYFNDLFMLLCEKDNVRKGEVKVKSLLRGTEIDDLFDKIWCDVEDLIKNPYIKIDRDVGSIEDFIKPKDEGKQKSQR